MARIRRTRDGDPGGRREVRTEVSRQEGSLDPRPQQRPVAETHTTETETRTTAVPAEPPPPPRQQPGPDRRDERDEYESRVKPAQTSAAAAFALVFGVSALLFALSVILFPVGLVLSVIGIILGLIGIKRGGEPGLTGKGVAIGGLVLSVIALILSLLIALGITSVLNNESYLNRIERWLQTAQDRLPENPNIPNDVVE